MSQNQPGGPKQSKTSLGNKALVVLFVLLVISLPFWAIKKHKDDEEAARHRPTATPVVTATPTAAPTPTPTYTPKPEPTAEPTEAPTDVPTAVPTEIPTEVPTEAPAAEPAPESGTEQVTVPTEVPTAVPTDVPTAEPTAVPTEAPAEAAAAVVTDMPAAEPTAAPTEVPTAVPTEVPTDEPTEVPTAAPTAEPTAVPTEVPTAVPAELPTAVPTEVPTAVPTAVPTEVPTAVPTEVPTAEPTPEPTPVPTATPTPPPRYVSDPAILPGFEEYWLKSGQLLPVYSAPSTKSWRGAKNKAAVSTNDSVYISGRLDKWLLVSYLADGNRARIGYVEIKKIKGGIPDVPYLNFANTKAMILTACSLTDDPFYSGTQVQQLDAGAEVTYLATGENWAYIETTIGKQTVRGFIPRQAIVILNGREAGIGSVEASHYLSASKDPGAYRAESAIDRKLDTSWQVTLANVGDIRNVTYDIYLSKPTDVTTLAIWNGFWKISKKLDQYDRNARMKQIEISFLYAGNSGFQDPMIVTLPETRNWQKREIGCLVDINGHNSVQAIRIRLLDYYPGSYEKFRSDLCVSEIRVYGDE